MVSEDIAADCTAPLGDRFFLESFNQKLFGELTGVTLPFVQDNHSRSAQGVLRGLHYQVRQPQGKLVRVVRGSVGGVRRAIRLPAMINSWIALGWPKCVQLCPPGAVHVTRRRRTAIPT